MAPMLAVADPDASLAMGALAVTVIAILFARMIVLQIGWWMDDAERRRTAPHPMNAYGWCDRCGPSHRVLRP